MLPHNYFRLKRLSLIQAQVNKRTFTENISDAPVSKDSTTEVHFLDQNLADIQNKKESLCLENIKPFDE